MLVATSTTTGVVVNMRGITIASSYGSMSLQNANNVNITGGAITGVTLSASNILLNSSFVNTPVTNNGYITIQDSSGSTYKLMVGS